MHKEIPADVKRVITNINVTAIQGERVAEVEVFFRHEFGDDELRATVAELLQRLVRDHIEVVLIEGRSINNKPHATQSFGNWMLAQLALRRITLGLFNYHTAGYEIYFSYHRRWPVGNIKRSEVLKRRDSSANTHPASVRAPSTVRSSAVSLEEAIPELVELNRLVCLLERRSQSSTKRQARQAQVARLRQKLGILDVA